MLKIFMDMEFTGLYQHAELISIGMVTEDDETFYAEFDDYKRPVDSWIMENVVANLTLTPLGKHPDDEAKYWSWVKDGKKFKLVGNRREIATAIDYWFQVLLDVPVNKPLIEFWGDCLQYDWVLFCELFGGALKIPKCVYPYPFDICTLFRDRGIDPDINRAEFAKIENQNQHNALFDAKVIAQCYSILEMNRTSLPDHVYELYV